MKIRNGFVTNSSSSSFIVAFNNKSTIENDIDEILSRYTEENFDTSYFRCTFEDFIRNVKSVLMCSIKRDVISAKELRKILTEEFSHVAKWKYYYDTSYFTSKNGKEYLQSDEYKKLSNDFVKKHVSEIMKKLEGKSYIVYTSFSDNDGALGSFMEHDLMPYAKNTVHSFNHH